MSRTVSGIVQLQIQMAKPQGPMTKEESELFKQAFLAWAIENKLVVSGKWQHVEIQDDQVNLAYPENNGPGPDLQVEKE